MERQQRKCKTRGSHLCTGLMHLCTDCLRGSNQGCWTLCGGALVSSVLLTLVGRSRAACCSLWCHGHMHTPQCPSDSSRSLHAPHFFKHCIFKALHTVVHFSFKHCNFKHHSVPALHCACESVPPLHCACESVLRAVRSCW